MEGKYQLFTRSLISEIYERGVENRGKIEIIYALINVGNISNWRGKSREYRIYLRVN